MTTIAVQGPRSDKVHYLVPSGSSPVEMTYCGRFTPRYGWIEATDAMINESRSGICERCLLKYAGPMG